MSDTTFFNEEIYDSEEEYLEDMRETLEKWVGRRVRDELGREWTVIGVGSKDGWPTIDGSQFWARVDNVQVVG